MNWHKDRGPRGYHHGNLKEALIRAALDLIAEKGPSGFTFAEAARFAGVSPAAPYRHFRDRDELLASVACGGIGGRLAGAGAGITTLAGLLRWARERYPEQYPAQDWRSPLPASTAPFGTMAIKKVWASFLQWKEDRP
jgi:hypothetical protein